MSNQSQSNHKSSQNLNQQLRSLYALNICVTVVWLGLLLGLTATGGGTIHDTLAGFWERIPHTGLPEQALM